MKKIIKVKDEDKEFECCLDTLRIYENQFNRQLLNDFDIVNTDKEKSFTEKLYLMADILWALASSCNDKEKMTAWGKLDPAETIDIYNQAVDLILSSLVVQKKNA